MSANVVGEKKIETALPETALPETAAREAAVPETSAPEASAPEVDAPDMSALKALAPEPAAPEASAPAPAPGASASKASPHEPSVPEPRPAVEAESEVEPERSKSSKKQRRAVRAKSAGGTKALVVWREGRLHYADESVLVIDLDEAASPDVDVHDVVDRLAELRDAVESAGRAEAVSALGEIIQEKALS